MNDDTVVTFNRELGRAIPTVPTRDLTLEEYGRYQEIILATEKNIGVTLYEKPVEPASIARSGENKGSTATTDDEEPDGPSSANKRSKPLGTKKRASSARTMKEA